MKYFETYLKKKEKWIFFLLSGNRFARTNMHIENWHKTLKYSYLRGRDNKRIDKLIHILIEMSKNFEYKLHLKNNKGLISTTKKKYRKGTKTQKMPKWLSMEIWKFKYLIINNYLLVPVRAH